MSDDEGVIPINEGLTEAQLIQIRTTAKRSHTIIKNYTNTFNPTSQDIAGIVVRNKKMETIWKKYDKAQTLLESKDYEKHGNDREQFEQVFDETQTIMEQFIQGAAQRQEQTRISSSPSPTVTQIPLADVTTLITTAMSQHNLPTLSIKPFSGSYDQYRGFVDLFDSMVHNNSVIPVIQKFFHLKSVLIGEASRLIENLALTADNYEVARKALADRYDNDQFILNSHLKTLFEFTTMTKESVPDLRRLIHTTQQELQAIGNMEIDTSTWDPMIIYLIKHKVDPSTRKQWELSQRNPKQLPTMRQFYEFLEQRCFALEAAQSAQQDKSRKPIITHTKAHVISEQRVTNTCKLCQGKHQLFNCETFLNKRVPERMSAIKPLGICFNCLRTGHLSKDCRSSRCKKCNKPHNTLIHPEATTPPAETMSDSPQPVSTMPVNISQILTTRITTSNNHCSSQIPGLLPTAEVRAYGNAQDYQTCRALLDSGAQSHFITERLVHKLQLKTRRVDVIATGITNTEMKIEKQTTLTIRAHDGSCKFTITCLVIPRISDDLPTTSFERESIEIPTRLKLADPSFHISNRIDLLIGSDLFWNLLRPNRIPVDNHKQLMLFDTSLGWIIAGKLPRGTTSKTICKLATLQIHDQLEKFWSIEELPRKTYLTKEELQAEQHFLNTHEREKDGRFKVRLPFKSTQLQLGDTLGGAKQRLQHMERKLQKDSNLKESYHEFMTEYLQLNHMQETSKDETEDEIRTAIYLPHHAVVKLESTTTKTRVVFDASHKSSTGVSLNDILLIGPKTQDDLWDILVRFRQYQFVISADIAKMYRQILIHENDRKYQRIVWRTDPNHEMRRYELNTVTYGTSSAPYLATRCLKQLAIENEKQYPDASHTILRDFYVDDLLTGGDQFEFVKRLKEQVTQLLSTAGMELRKWNSNDKRLIADVDNSKTQPEQLCQALPALDETPKTLGLRWNAEQDTITFKTSPNVQEITTKRQILSEIAKLYDPLGLISPCVVIAKIIMQKLWQTHTTWDAPVSLEILRAWTQFQASLSTIDTLQIPRLTCLANTVQLELHIFADASEAAYGAVVYVLSIDALNQRQSRLMCSKSRIAPLKRISLPKLELCAAFLAAQLGEKTLQTLTIPITKITYWTDSMIVLHWINGEPAKFKTFIANRISEIQQRTEPRTWKHISGKLNPADLISRGAKLDDLPDSWWSGPSFLEQEESHWPTPIESPLDQSQLELKSVVTLKTTIGSISDIGDVTNRFSSWSHCIRVLSYCLRFYNQVRKSINNRSTVAPQVLPARLPMKVEEQIKDFEPLQTIELEATTIRIIRTLQEQTFTDEVNTLRSGQTISRKSKLLALHPFIDSNNCLRVGGRLRHANINIRQKFPLLLPSNHVITRLIFQSLHKQYLHCGVEQLLSITRLRYWSIGGRKLARETISKCTECIRFKPSVPTYLMGELPQDRIEAGIRPFTSVGVDFAGPLTIKEGNRRKPVLTKAYVAVFVCFSCKAVHLELVSSLSTEAFLNALKRFIARRGLPYRMYSDNGTNFIGANNELTDIYNFMKTNHNVIIEEVHNLKIDWKFQPPRAPNFGGLWESTVKSMKRHLYKVTHGFSFTFEESYTLLTQIESVLNSRPLSPLSSDPNDLNVLTPSHFLIGDTLLEPPDRDYTQTNRLSRHQHLQQMRQHFWNRWRREYLHTLQVRKKWQLDGSTSVEVDDLVLLMEDGVPPLHWRRGRVIALHPGKDGITRVITVKTTSGIYKRSVRKVCLLKLNA